MAVAYGKVHPSPQEFSVVGADGALVYPISENNYFQIRYVISIKMLMVKDNRY